MKLNLKVMAAAAILAASGARSGEALAQPPGLQPDSLQTARLTYSGQPIYNEGGELVSVSGAVGALGSSGLSVIGGFMTSTSVQPDHSGTLVTTGIETTLDISSYLADPTTGAVTQILTDNQPITWYESSGRYLAEISALRVDLNSHQVFANLTARAYGPDGELTGSSTRLGQALWTFDGISGARTVPHLDGVNDPISALQAAGFYATTAADGSQVFRGLTELEGLRLTDTGFSFLETAFALTAGSAAHTAVMAVNADSEGWGKITYRTDLRFDLTPPPVPEPRTGLLALLGLCFMGIALHTRRRASHSLG